MATVFAPLWYCGARDTAGVAIATGKAYFYVVGSTSTFITIYADALETEPITHDADHPVTLDAGGRAKVFLKTPAKVVITDADDVVKQTITEGTSTHLGLIAGTWDGTADTPTQDALTAIEASLGANAKYLLQAGATARLYHDVVAQFVTPKDYAAVGDGTADDTTPLQNAINAAISLGIPLNLEKATYKITAGLTAAGILNIYGAGMSESIISTTATGITGLTIAAASGSYLRDFAVHLPYDGTTYDQAISIGGSGCTVERVDVTGGQGIYSTATHTRVVDCVVAFKCPNTAGAYGSGISVSANSVVDNCLVNGQVGNSASYLTRGIAAHSGSVVTACKVSNCYVGGSGLFIRTDFASCTTVNAPLTAYEGAIACSATTYTNGTVPAATGYISIGNDFDTAQVVHIVRSTSAEDEPTLYFDAAREVNVLHPTYAGTITQLTVELSPTSPPLKIGQKFTIVVQAGAGTTISGIVLSLGSAVSETWTSLGSNFYRSANFIVSSSGHLAQVTPWLDISSAAEWEPV